MEEENSNIKYFNVKDIGPYKEEKEKATKHVAGVIGRTYEETNFLIESGKVYLFIDKETDETWFEVFD